MRQKGQKITFLIKGYFIIFLKKSPIFGREILPNIPKNIDFRFFDNIFFKNFAS